MEAIDAIPESENEVNEAEMYNYGRALAKTLGRWEPGWCGNDPGANGMLFDVPMGFELEEEEQFVEPKKCSNLTHHSR